MTTGRLKCGGVTVSEIFTAMLTRIAITKQRGDGKHSKRESQTTTQLLQGDCSVSSALTPPNMQTTVMQALLPSAHVLIPECHEQNQGIRYLSLREDRFSTELGEDSWTAGAAEPSREAAERVSLLRGAGLTSSLQTELSKPFPLVDFAWKTPHQTQIYYQYQDVQFSCFYFSARKVKDCIFIQEYLSAGERARTLISYTNPWCKVNHQVSEESVGK